MLGVAARIDLEVLNQMIRNSSGNSMTFRAVVKNAKSGDWTPSFSIGLAYKDMLNNRHARTACPRTL